MRTLKLIFKIIIFILLTLLTQVGGIFYLISFITYNLIHGWTKKKSYQRILKFSSFLLIYCLASFTLVPFTAGLLGRVQLPLTATNNLQPLNILTYLLNRNYVRKELRQTVFEVAAKMNNQFPGTIINYLDAGFPFFDGFPLLPHLSHSDGKKLDLSFCYIDIHTGKETNTCPSFIGYGICEEPLPNEQSTTDLCATSGHWQYNLLRAITPQGNKTNFLLASNKTSVLITLFASHISVGKIFMEPHLKKRFNLTSDKIRFQGCRAVRHDDHIHIQLK